MGYTEIVKEFNHRINAAIGEYYDTIEISVDDAREIVKILEKMYKQIEDTHSCKLCANQDVCSPDAEDSSSEYLTFIGCRGSLKENWKWKDVH